jgi:hypothetical protein
MFFKQGVGRVTFFKSKCWLVGDYCYCGILGAMKIFMKAVPLTLLGISSLMR